MELDAIEASSRPEHAPNRTHVAGLLNGASADIHNANNIANIATGTDITGGDDFWNGISLDSILGAGIPNFDLSLYQTLGSTILTPPSNQTVPQIPDALSHAFGHQISASAPRETISWEQPSGNEGLLPQSLPTVYSETNIVSHSGLTDAEFLNEFCKSLVKRELMCR